MKIIFVMIFIIIANNLTFSDEYRAEIKSVNFNSSAVNTADNGNDQYSKYHENYLMYRRLFTAGLITLSIGNTCLAAGMVFGFIAAFRVLVINMAESNFQSHYDTENKYDYEAVYPADLIVYGWLGMGLISFGLLNLIPAIIMLINGKNNMKHYKGLMNNDENKKTNFNLNIKNNNVILNLAVKV